MKPYDRTLLEIFAAEQAEHVQGIRAVAGALAQGASESQGAAIEDVLRRLHTLKGAARAVGLDTIELIVHRLEALFVGVREGGLPGDAQVVATLHRSLDEVEDILAAALGNHAEPDASKILGEFDALLQTPEPVGVPGIAPAAPPPVAATVTEFVRVSAANLDRLIRTASQMLAASSPDSVADQRGREYQQRAEETLTELARLRRKCVSYLRAHRDEADLTPVRECLEFADTALHSLVRSSQSLTQAQNLRAWELRQLATGLHQDAVRVRMIPADSVFGPFGVMVREMAHAEHKEVEFRVEGLDVEADRLVLQALKDPVMHLLRNAVSHGIESPEERAAAGKPVAGMIRLAIDSRGDRLHITVEDDGRGLDRQAVLQQALKQGLLTEADGETQTPDELLHLIFRPGFSTANTITSLSGRGMGLSVVEQIVAQLHGEIRVRPRAGAGLQITISAALSISTQHVLQLSAGGHIFGLPSRFVERVFRARVTELEMIDGREVVMLDTQPVPVVPLVDLLALPAVPSQPAAPEEDKDNFLAIAIVAFGELRAGVIVDRFLDDRDIVVKDLGLPSHMAGFTAGGVPLEDGTVMPLLNPVVLLDRFLQTSRTPKLRQLAETSQKPARQILIVDDSITTRSLEKSILEAHGYRVRVAVDGVEALDKLGAERPDLVITDVMMPRMTGLQLLEQMKKRKELENIPVIIVTSLDRPEDQEKGLSLGADAYIVKRKFDQRELLNTVRQIL